MERLFFFLIKRIKIISGHKAQPSRDQAVPPAPGKCTRAWLYAAPDLDTAVTQLNEPHYIFNKSSRTSRTFI